MPVYVASLLSFFQKNPGGISNFLANSSCPSLGMNLEKEKSTRKFDSIYVITILNRVDQRKWHVNIQSENCRPLQLVLSSTNSLLVGHSMTTWTQFVFIPNIFLTKTRTKVDIFWTTYPRTTI